MTQPPQPPPSIARYGPGVPTPPQKKRTPTWVIVTATVFAAACGIPVVLGTINAATSSSTTSEPSGLQQQPKVNTVPLSAGEQLAKEITDKLGKPNRDAPPVKVACWPDDPTRTIDVQWAFNDNLTEGLIRTGARGDVLDIIRIVKAKATWPYTALRLKATFSMADKYGNAAETVVLDLTYSHTTIEKINPDGIPLERVFSLADSGTVHPEFR